MQPDVCKHCNGLGFLTPGVLASFPFVKTCFQVWCSYQIFKSLQYSFSIEDEEMSDSLLLTIFFLSLNNEETLGSLIHFILLVENTHTPTPTHPHIHIPKCSIRLFFYVVND